MLNRAGSGQIQLQNLDFDTGRAARVGEYALSDRTCLKLLDKLSKRGPEHVPADVRENLLAYFSQLQGLARLQSTDRKHWKKAVVELNALKQQAAPWHASVQSPR